MSTRTTRSTTRKNTTKSGDLTEKLISNDNHSECEYPFDEDDEDDDIHMEMNNNNNNIWSKHDDPDYFPEEQLPSSNSSSETSEDEDLSSSNSSSETSEDEDLPSSKSTKKQYQQLPVDDPMYPYFDEREVPQMRYKTRISNDGKTPEWYIETIGNTGTYWWMEPKGEKWRATFTLLKIMGEIHGKDMEMESSLFEYYYPQLVNEQSSINNINNNQVHIYNNIYIIYSTSNTSIDKKIILAQITQTSIYKN